MSSIKVHVLQTGKVKVDKALPFYKSPLGFTGLFSKKENKITLPVSTYLIEHPKGLILFDTGWSKNIRDAKQKKLSFGEISSGVLPEGQAIDEQLAKLGYQPEDLDFVLLSHLDGDHIGGIPYLAKAKQFMVSQQEMHATKGWQRNIRYDQKYWKDVNFKLVHFNANGIGPKNASYDLFQDGSVQLVWTPGHSNGLMSILITNEQDQFILLVADVGYASKSWKQMILPGITINKKDGLASLRWVQKMNNNENCLAALANHDPDIKPHTITF